MKRSTKRVIFSFLFVCGGVIYAMVGQPEVRAIPRKDWQVYLSDFPPLLKAFWEDPAHTAEFTPTSPVLAQHIADMVPRDVRTVLEVGPGTGPVTRALLRTLPKGVEFDAVEYSERLFGVLRERLGEHESDRIRFHRSAIQEWQQPEHIEQYDAIVSTLPKTQLPQPVLAEIYEKYDQLLKPGGFFISVMLIGAHPVTRARKQARRWGSAFLSCFSTQGEEALRISEQDIEDYERLAAFIDEWEGSHFEPIRSDLVKTSLPPINVFVQQKRGRALSERSNSGSSLGHHQDSPVCCAGQAVGVAV